MPLPDPDFMLEVSEISLQELELAALNRSANISKSLKRELDLWVEQTACAMLARWMRDNRETILRAGMPEIGPTKHSSVDFFKSLEVKKTA